DGAVPGEGELECRPDEAAEDPAEREAALGCKYERALVCGRGDEAPASVRADVGAAVVDRRAEAVACRVLELRVVGTLGELAELNIGGPVTGGRGAPGIECGLEEAGGPLVG